MTGVLVVGVGMTTFGKFLNRGIKSLSSEAVAAALADSGLRAGDVEFAAVGNAMAGLITGQECIRGQVVLRECGIGAIPIVNVENACASSSTAFHVAWQAVASGAVDIALAVGVEKLTHEDKTVSLKAFGGAVDVELSTGKPGGGTSIGGATETPSRSVFMDLYAASVRAHIQQFGMTKEQMAMVTVKNRRFGALNPYAQHRQPVTVQQVLNDRVIAEPLTRMMCSSIGDGAAATILMSASAASTRGLRNRPRVLASVLTSGSLPASDLPSAERRAVLSAYELAGVGPADLDVVEVHDAASPAELMAYEEIGLCEPGEGGTLIESGATDLGGRCPVNTSGGLVARGHPVGATGLAQICELAWQLRGRCGSRQVDEARLALAQNGGGSLGNDTAAQVVTILAR
ncbi:thiolase family protein [Nocardia sp. SC052]|uniref:thiolase family protein n=1 Tax=Nocardia sichangensis TaxID=3385975 RepID=UPI0039A3EC42